MNPDAQSDSADSHAGPSSRHGPSTEVPNPVDSTSDSRSLELLASQVVIVITIVAVIALAILSEERGLRGVITAADRSAPLPTGFSLAQSTQVAPVICSNAATAEYPIAEAGLADDCTLLLAAKPSVAGEQGLNWSAEIPLTDWSGVILGASPTRIVALDLTTSGLIGQVPPVLGNLAGLQALHLYGNQLTGEIPSELGRLTNLTTLDLGANQLTGTIPPQLGGLANLTSIDLSFNDLTGPVPQEFSTLTNLEWLVISGNDLSGSITGLFDDLTKLNYISIHETQLTGCLPSRLRDIDGFVGELTFCDVP